MITDKAEELIKIKEELIQLKEKYEATEAELIQLMKDKNQSQIKLTGLVLSPKYVEAKVKIQIKMDKGKVEKNKHKLI